ncbi:MAG: phage portal protein [Eggerthellaceae bacterium]|nr:phage portal protein [Eggerthellaceae bacterium]
MALLDGLRRRYQQRWYGWQPSFNVQVANLDTAALYRTQPNLRAAVSFLADNAAQVPLKVHRRAADDDRPRVLDSPAALLLQRPNAETTPFELKRAIYSDMLLYGYCLTLVLPDKDAPSGWQIRQIPATWVNGYNGNWPFAPDSVIVTHNGLSVEVPWERFILFHGYDPTDPTKAASPVEALKDVLHEQVESNTFRRQMWQRGGRFNAYITRPKDVESWTDEAFERFRETWRNSWAGDGAADGGGTPILEDGMEIKQVQFNSRDAQWADAKTLGREDVAGVYHFNPALLWPGTGQTYASAKDNARALYNDALAPSLMQVTDRLNQFLLPMVGEPEDNYIAYDITIKTEGTFEEKLAALQSATGAPILTRNEARAKLDLPAVEGGDELITPLNVLAGAVDSAPQPTLPDAGEFAAITATKDAPEPKRYKAAPMSDDDVEMAVAFKEFFKHQRDVLLPKLGAKAKNPEWWNADRWNAELTNTLYPIALRQCTTQAKRTLSALLVDSSTYSEARTQNYVRAMTESRARMVNATTLKQLKEVDEWEGDEDAERATYAGVFDMAEDSRSDSAGAAFACAVAGFAATEAISQCASGSGATKTWVVTSGNPRPEHAAMDGETVPYNDEFSNGAMWPGDADALDVADVANCQCQVEITIP